MLLSIFVCIMFILLIISRLSVCNSFVFFWLSCWNCWLFCLFLGIIGLKGNWNREWIVCLFVLIVVMLVGVIIVSCLGGLVLRVFKKVVLLVLVLLVRKIYLLVWVMNLCVSFNLGLCFVFVELGWVECDFVMVF